MRAGRLRHRVTIQEPTGARDSKGDPAESWRNVFTAWASIDPVSGREYYRADQGWNAETTHAVRLRYQSGVKPQMRVSYGRRAFLILSVLNKDEAGRELELLCKEEL